MPFNFNQKNVLLTYSQCPVSKEEILSHLQALHEVGSYTISQEKHGDGNFHIHALITFATKLHTRSERYFDLGVWHPNIKPLKTKRDVVQARAYVIKDGEYITNVQEVLGKRAILAKAILDEGKITKKLIVQNPEIIFLNYSSISQWLAIVRSERSEIPQIETQKKRHIWLTGVSNSGKTYWLRNYLSLCSFPQEIPTNNDYGHIDRDVDCLYHDEYKGALTVQQLNKLCDGYTRLNTKGSSTWISNPTVVIVSNFTIRDCYSKIEDVLIDSLLNRFQIYDASYSLPRMRFYNLNLKNYVSS